LKKERPGPSAGLLSNCDDVVDLSPGGDKELARIKSPAEAGLVQGINEP
jgi:hypothetical protein